MGAVLLLSEEEEMDRMEQRFAERVGLPDGDEGEEEH
jgi:hypothetical protein